MYQAADLPVTSVKALISTISIDKQVYRWFEHLISQPMVRKELLDSKEIASVYNKLRIIFILQIMILMISVGILFLIAQTLRWEYGLMAVALLGIHILNVGQKRRAVINICAFLVNRDFELFSFAQKTLFQIGEIYGRKYQVVGLVEAMSRTEELTRSATFYMFIFATIIYPLNFWQTLGSVLVVYYIFFGIIGGIWLAVKRSKK